MILSASERAARRARGRIGLIALVFVLAMGLAVARLGGLAAEGVALRADRPADLGLIETASVRVERAELVDRRGAPLVVNAPTYKLYLDRAFLALPEERDEAAALLAATFPERVDAAALREQLGDRRDGTITVLFRATPLEAQRAFELGIAGLYRAERTDRVYLGGRSTAHVLGYVNVDGVGLAGAEGGLDEMIRTPGAGPVRLSLDLRVQRRVWRILSDAMARYDAKAAAAIVMSVETGEIYAMVSLPDFDPHRALDDAFADGPEDPRFHWAVNTGYEPGSTMKLATYALALDSELVGMGTMFDAPQSIWAGGIEVRDRRAMGEIALPQAFARSSNVIAASLALELGEARVRAFYEALGLTRPSRIEVLEAQAETPGWHAEWRVSSTATTSFGHGVRMSPVHVAEMTATLIGGGELVEATLIADRPLPLYRERVVSSETSLALRELMRLVVAPGGTATAAAVDGLDVGGKTGTAEKLIDGVYSDDRNVANFVAAFPMRDPQFVVIVMLDEAQTLRADGEATRFAGATSAPTAAEIIEAIAPLLLVPREAPAP